MTGLGPPPCDAIVFDCDGTLADTFAMHFATLRAVFATRGLDFDEAWYRERVGLSAVELLAEVGSAFGVLVDAETLERERQPLLVAALGGVRAIEPVAAIATAYAGRVPLAVASGGPRPVVLGTLEAIGLRPLFAAIVTIEDVARGKPAPDLYEAAAARLGVPPGRCVAYDDTDEGVASARAAGMIAIDVRPHVPGRGVG